MAFRGSNLESDSCRGGKTSPSTGRHVQGITESDGCPPVRQTMSLAPQLHMMPHSSKGQGGYTGSPIDERWSSRTTRSTTEEPTQEHWAFGSGTFRDSARQILPEQMALGSGTLVDQKPSDHRSSPEQRTYYGSGTFGDPATVPRQSSPEQRTYGSGTVVDQVRFDVRSSPEQRTSLSAFPTQLYDDYGVVEDRLQSDEEREQSDVTTAMETWTIDDDDDDDTVPLPESTAAASLDPAAFAQDEDGDTTLHLAIISERSDLALCLIHLAPDPLWLDLTNQRMQTPLHLATIRRQPNVIRRLLSRGAKRVVHDLRGNTPLHIACEKGHIDCVQALISSCPASAMTSDDLGLNKFNYEGLTCLHLAASKNQIDIIRYLVENCRLNVNQKELRRGCTILHLAVMTSNVELLTYLLSLPASAELIIDEPTYDDYTALRLSHLTRQTYIEQMLRLAGAHSVLHFDDRPPPQS